MAIEQSSGVTALLKHYADTFATSRTQRVQNDLRDYLNTRRARQPDKRNEPIPPGRIATNADYADLQADPGPYA